LHFCLSVNDLFLTLDKGIVKYYIGDSSSLDFIELINYKIGTTSSCNSKALLSLKQLELIPGPVWLACRLLPKWYRTWDQAL